MLNNIPWMFCFQLLTWDRQDRWHFLPKLTPSERLSSCRLNAQVFQRIVLSLHVKSISPICACRNHTHFNLGGRRVILISLINTRRCSSMVTKMVTLRTYCNVNSENLVKIKNSRHDNQNNVASIIRKQSWFAIGWQFCHKAQRKKTSESLWLTRQRV